MKKKLIISLISGVVFILLFGINCAFADVVDKSDEYNGLAYPKAVLKEGIESPYSVSGSIEEIINPATGSLEIKQTDLYLKGRNGLDLS